MKHSFCIDCRYATSRKAILDIYWLKCSWLHALEVTKEIRLVVLIISPTRKIANKVTAHAL